MPDRERRGYYRGIEGIPNDIKEIGLAIMGFRSKTEYTKLRKFLLKDGYIRIASEVFMRVVQNRKASEKHYRRIDEIKPKTGVVRLIRLTEKQYNNIYMVTGEPDYQEKKSWCKLPYNDIILPFRNCVSIRISSKNAEKYFGNKSKNRRQKRHEGDRNTWCESF